MYLDRKQNIFKNIWFNLLVVPIITFIFAIVKYFADHFDDADKIIMTYLTIGVSALITQFFFYLKKPVKHSSLHYLYIIFSINISLFFGYILEKFILPNYISWEYWVVKPIIALAIIFVIKTILWIFLNILYRRRVKKDKYKSTLEKENEKLKSSIKNMEEKLSNQN